MRPDLAFGVPGGPFVTAVALATCASVEQSPPENLVDSASIEQLADGPSSPASEASCVDSGRFLASPQTVLDRSTGLVWQRTVTARLSQSEASSYCGSLSLGGLRDFRLPSPPELRAIRYRPGGLFGGGAAARYCVPCIDQEAFPETPADAFWTNGTAPDGTGWCVGFDDGRSHRDAIADSLWVRCVVLPVPAQNE